MLFKGWVMHRVQILDEKLLARGRCLWQTVSVQLPTGLSACTLLRPACLSPPSWVSSDTSSCSFPEYLHVCGNTYSCAVTSACLPSPVCPWSSGLHTPQHAVFSSITVSELCSEGVHLLKWRRKPFLAPLSFQLWKVVLFPPVSLWGIKPIKQQSVKPIRHPLLPIKALFWVASADWGKAKQTGAAASCF